MTEEPVSFTGRLSMQDYLDMKRCERHLVMRPGFELAILYFASLFLGLGLLLGILAGSWNTAPLILLIGLVPFVWKSLRTHMLKRHYRQNEASFTENTVTFTGRTISLGAGSHRTELDYHRLSHIAVTPRGMLFLLAGGQIWFWLPQRLFQGNHHQETLLRFARGNSIPVRTPESEGRSPVTPLAIGGLLSLTMAMFTARTAQVGYQFVAPIGKTASFLGTFVDNKASLAIVHRRSTGSVGKITLWASRGSDFEEIRWVRIGYPFRAGYPASVIRVPLYPLSLLPVSIGGIVALLFCSARRKRELAVAGIR